MLNASACHNLHDKFVIDHCNKDYGNIYNWQLKHETCDVDIIHVILV